jgi:hypothetical protein
MTHVLSQLLLLGLVVTFLAAATAGEAFLSKEDPVCFGTATITPGEAAPGPSSQVGCVVPQETRMVPLVRVDAAAVDGASIASDSGSLARVMASLDDTGRLVRLDPRPERVSAVLVPHEARGENVAAWVVIGRPSLSLGGTAAPATLTLGAGSSTLLVEWTTPRPCALDIDGRATGTPSFAHWAPGDRPTYAFPGTEEGCPTGSFTFENLGAWTVA